MPSKLISSDSKHNFFLKAGSKKKSFKDIELVIWILPLTLVILSSILIASTQRQFNDSSGLQHIIIAGVGIFIAYFISQFHLGRFRKFLIPLYLITLLSLFAVKIFGTSALGAQRWLSIGSFNIQPSEIAKLVVIIALASVLEHQKFYSPIYLFKPLGVIVIPWILIFTQPDLGTSLVFGAVLLVMLYWAGMPLEWVLLFLSGIFTSILVGVLKSGLFLWIPFMGFLAYRSLPRKYLSSFLTIVSLVGVAFSSPWLWNNFLKDYQRERLILFLDPGQDPLGGGYHLIQSTIGIGSGGLFGTGLLQGQLTKLRFIPEQHTDFIFSALGEELGFMGTLFVSVAFFLLIFRLIRIARDARTKFESLVVIGIATMIMFQVVVNIFMTIGLGPITGIPLPFMSYGRTALLMAFISLGLCLSVSRRTKSFTRS